MTGNFLTLLDEHGGGSPVRLGTGRTLFKQGDQVRWLYRVTTGRIRLSRVLARGAEIALSRINAGGLVAEASVFSQHYHCDAIAEVSTTLHRFTMNSVRALLEHKPAASQAYGAHLAAELMDLRAVVEIRAIRRADDRVLAWLRYRATGNPRTYDRNGTWAAVAKQIGLTGESLYRALARLERAKIIVRLGSKVVFRK